MRLTKGRRLRKRPEFRRLTEVGRRIPTAHFVLVVARRVDGGPSRLGITASRRVGCAVRRNRLKRLVREAFRALPEIVPEGHDLVVICKKDDPLLTFRRVLDEWSQAQGRVRRALSHGGRPRDPRGGTRPAGPAPGAAQR